MGGVVILKAQVTLYFNHNVTKYFGQKTKRIFKDADNSTWLQCFLSHSGSELGETLREQKVKQPSPIDQIIDRGTRSHLGPYPAAQGQVIRRRRTRTHNTHTLTNV